MCLCRIDYNARAIPRETEVSAYKVFRLMEDGTLRNLFGGINGVPDGTVPIGQWVGANPWPNTVYGKRGMGYPTGFHASTQRYSLALAKTQARKRDTKYHKQVDTQLWAIQRSWSKEDPLQVTVQPPTHKYVCLPVRIRGVHTIGRQYMNQRRNTARTWVADEMLVHWQVSPELEKY